jgi:nucleotide-binding universal stress UspA family protein
VAVDCSDQSVAAARKAIQMAKRDKSEVILFHVIQFSAEGHYSSEVFDELLRKGRENAAKWFSDIRTKAGETGVRFRTKATESIGSPASAIIRFAEKEAVDLIVMGTKGRTRATRRLIGSTALGVVVHHRAP